VPDDEVLRDSMGRVVDDVYVESVVEDAVRKARKRGRPSLSESGESPLLRVRISPELDEAISRAAEAAGESRAEWVRRTLSRAVRRAG
jgi:predicted HicB family RNase H-like nuclease